MDRENETEEINKASLLWVIKRRKVIFMQKTVAFGQIIIAKSINWAKLERSLKIPVFTALLHPLQRFLEGLKNKGDILHLIDHDRGHMWCVHVYWQSVIIYSHRFQTCMTFFFLKNSLQKRYFAKCPSCSFFIQWNWIVIYTIKQNKNMQSFVFQWRKSQMGLEQHE